MLPLAAILLLFATRAGAQCPDGTPPPCGRPAVRTAKPVPPLAERSRRFVLLPFRNVTRRTTEEWLVAGGSLILGEKLSRYRDLIVVPDGILTAARRRLRIPNDSVPDAAQLRRIAEETDGWTAISGNVFAAGTRIRISVQAIDVPTGTVTARAEEEVAENADARDAFTELSARLLEAAGVRGTASTSAAQSTSSLDAYRAYVEGMVLLRQAAFTRARAKFADAVRLDSTFALAWAKLAVASVAWDMQALANPLSPAYRAIEQANKYIANVPERDGARVRLAVSFLRGEVGRARQLADSLVRTDPDDLDAMELLVVIEMLDPLLDTTSPTPRMRGSANRRIALAKELIERDPGRRYIYAALIHAYGAAAGLWGGTFGGIRAESPSLAATLRQRADITYSVTLQDSIALVPVAEFARLSLPERTTLRRKAAAAADVWAQRWLTQGNEDAEAHAWASRVAELLGDYPRAMREILIADSIGMESPLESVVGRRIALELAAGHFARAADIADSLHRAGVLAQNPLSSTLDRSRRSGIAALLLDKRWARLVAVAEAMPQIPAQPACAVIFNELSVVNDWVMPPDIRRAVADTVAMHFTTVSATPLERCVEAIMTGADLGARPLAASTLARIADSLQQAGNAVVAYRAARAAGAIDSTLRPALEARPWFAERSRALAVLSNFSVTSIIVEGDSVTYSFKRTNTNPLVIDAPGMATNWQLSTRVTSESTDSVRFFARIGHSAPPSETGATGGVLQFVQSINNNSAEAVSPQQRIATGTVTAAAVPDGFRVVIRGEMVALWKRRQPPIAEIFSTPCIGTTEGLCGQRPVPITYR